MNHKRTTKPAFSLVELVVVIIIIAILAAMAIPRLSRGSAGAADSALAGNLAVLRNAIELYAAEHNNDLPGTGGDFVDQLTGYTDIDGDVKSAPDATHIYGPYLVAIPPNPVGSPSKPTEVLIDSTNAPPAVVTDNGEGWVYSTKTGQIRANVTGADDSGTDYADY